MTMTIGQVAAGAGLNIQTVPGEERLGAVRQLVWGVER